MKAILRQAGVRDARVHDARHTAATLLIEQGVHIRVVQEILGHTRVTTPERGPAPELEKLAAELCSQGYQAQLMTPAGRLPYLHVRNPQAAMLAEDVYATDGWYWYGWAERIAKVTDLAAASAKVARVLRVA